MEWRKLDVREEKSDTVYAQKNWDNTRKSRAELKLYIKNDVKLRCHLTEFMIVVLASWNFIMLNYYRGNHYDLMILKPVDIVGVICQKIHFLYDFVVDVVRELIL